MIYSSSYIWSEYKFGNNYRYVLFQGLFLIIGILLMILFSKINYKIYKKKANIILLVCFLLLLLVLIPGIGEMRNGSMSWFGIGPFGLQPSEISKVALIIFTAKYLEKNNKDVKNAKSFILPIFILLLLFFLLIMLEPDFGTGMIIVCSVMTLIFIAGSKLKIFLKIIIGGLLGIIALIIVAPYRLKRIISFINPWNDALGSGFQIIQSLYAIGPGEPLG